MINDASDAKDAVVDVVQDALVGHFDGGNVEVLDDGLFDVGVELPDGTFCSVLVRVS